MEATVLNRIRKKMDYDKSKSPFENLKDFFSGVTILRYELSEEKIDKKKREILRSAWKNEHELREIINRFHEEFTEHLIKMSTDEKTVNTYPITLKECKNLLRKINRKYSPSSPEVMILFRDSKHEEWIVSFDSLSEKQKESIFRCYELLALMAKDLVESVNEEEKDFESNNHVRTNSTYQWVTDKNDFSELALAIFASGALKRRKGLKMKPSTFARELAAFFGIKTLNYDQDIALISARSARRKQGEFLDKCKKNLLIKYEEKLEGRRPKTD